jgi:hypothetical protein
VDMTRMWDPVTKTLGNFLIHFIRNPKVE